MVSVIILATVSVCDAGEEREWTDSSGSFRIKAEFLSLDGSTVLLKEKNGRKRSIPLSRLSTADQKLAREMAKKEESDPFKAVDEDTESDADESEMKSSKSRPSRRSRKPPAENDEDNDQEFEVEDEGEQRPPIIKPKWKSAPELQLISKKKKKWQIAVTPTELLDYEPDLTELPEKRDFFERESGFAVNSQARTAVMSYTLESRGRMGRTGEISSRFVVMNIEKGRATANAVTKGKWKVATIHPDGERFVLIGEDGEDSGILATCTAKGDNFEMEERWRPYPPEGTGKQPVSMARFINESDLITGDAEGSIGVWNFDEKRLQFHFKHIGNSPPAVSPDGSYITYATRGQFGLIHVDSKEVVTAKTEKAFEFGARMAFSPSGKLLALATGHHEEIIILDVATGEIRYRGEVPGITLAFGLEFPAEDYLLLSNEYLFYWPNQIKVWQYTRGGAAVCERGYTFFQGDGAVLPAALPHEYAVQMLEEAKKNSDLFVVSKGSQIQIDVSGVGTQFQKQAEDALKKQVEAAGCVVATAAPVRLKASTSGPTQEDIRYFSAGTFKFNQYTSKVEIEFDGKVIWQNWGTNVPGVLTEQRDKSYQQQVDEAGSKPNIEYFSFVNLPSYLQKPSGDNPHNSQTLGVSDVNSPADN